MKHLMLIVSIAVASLGCKGKPKGDRAAGSGAGGSATTAGTGGGEATAAVPAAGGDPARDAVATATDDVAKLVAPAAEASAGGDKVGRAIDALVEASRGMSREAWDPAAVVASVGKDRNALFTWVRDHTALVPYRGSLRGAVGVMMDRVGNSLDRALLLAELLKQAGLETRLATAQLDSDTAAKVAASWSTRTRPPLPNSPALDEASIAGLVADLGVDAAGFTATTNKLEAAYAGLATNARKRIADQTQVVAKLIPGTAPAPEADPSALADHWWVQVHGDGGWTELDPTLPDANPGETLVAATETLAPDQLGDDRRHTVVVRVIGEVWHGEAREETTLLEYEFAPSLFYGQRIVVTNSALDLPDDDTVLAAKDPAAAMRAALIDQTEWIPVVQIGQRPVVKMTVTDGGDAFDISAGDVNTTRLARAIQHATQKAVGGATDLLGTLPDDTGPPVEPKPPIGDHAGFTGEWLELELRAPGSAPRVIRREVFDALGGADRTTAKPVKLSDAARLDRALALGAQTELLPMFARIPPAFVADRTVKALVEAKPVLVELAGQRGTPVTKALRDRLAGLTPVPGALYGLALARFEWSAAADQVYLDRLDLLAEHRRTVMAGAKARWQLGFDIMANDVSVWPSTGTDARGKRIAQGVADTAAEAFVLECPEGPIGCVRGFNASDELASSSVGWKVVAPGSSADSTGLPARARALAAADLAAGYAVIVSPRGAPTWWRLHPETGEALGMGVSGGDATVEQAVLAMTVAGLGGVACTIGSGNNDQLIDCLGAITFGAIGGIATIEYRKYRAIAWASSIIGSLLGIRAVTD